MRVEDIFLNSLHITPISLDHSDRAALTPGHFLVGDSLAVILERDVTSLTSLITNLQIA